MFLLNFRCSFWCTWVLFWRPWAFFWGLCAASHKNYSSGANWTRILGPNRGPLWLQFSLFLKRSRFWAMLFDGTFSESFFSCFLVAPGQPETMKIEQNLRSVARKQGLAKVEKITSWDHFGLHFGRFFGALERHLWFVSCFFCVLVLNHFFYT